MKLPCCPDLKYVVRIKSSCCIKGDNTENSDERVYDISMLEGNRQIEILELIEKIIHSPH